MTEALTLPQRLRALAGEPWPFPVPDPDFGMTGNVMREAASRIEELEAALGGVHSGNTHQQNTPAAAGVGEACHQTFCTPDADDSGKGKG